MMARSLLIVRLIQVCLFALVAGPLAAHSTPNSEVRLRVSEDVIIADIIVPRGEYAYGTGNPVGGGARSLGIAREYLRERIKFSTPDGRDWTVRFRTIEFVQLSGPPDLHALAEMAPPAGGPLQEFTIDWQVLTDTLPGHFALFVLDGPTEAADGRIIGAMRSGSRPLEVEIVSPAALDLLASSAALGAHHIVEGYDHLLFLLALLLPAPLVARAGRWAEPCSTRATIVKLVKIVTAFTAGHSLTLVAATLGHWSLPVTPVEIAIAVSVLISAMHAARPILPGKEPLVALVFGLVHGLAFATLVQEAQSGMAGGLLTLFGFNLGVELVQLAIVALVIPSLLVFSRHAFYPAVRQTLALLCAAAAIAWIVNRTTGLAEGVIGSMEFVMSQVIWLAIVTSLLALGVALWRKVATEPRVSSVCEASA